MKPHNVKQWPDYLGNALYQGEKSKEGFHKEILDKLHQALGSMTAPRRWTFVFRLDLKFPSDYPPQTDNLLLSQFMESFMDGLRQQCGSAEYVWVREQLSSANPHYHLVFFVNGDRTYSGWNWLQKATDIWGSLLGIMYGEYDGLVHVPNPEPMSGPNTPDYGRPVSYGMMIDARAASVEARKQEVYTWISYLAKAWTKCPRPGCHNFGTSRF